MRAYRLLENRLSGAPTWINTERFDVVGLAPGATTSDEITPRLQTLLAERFKMAAHTEKRQIPVLLLVVANKNGRLGPKFHKSTNDCLVAAPAGCGVRLTSSSLVTAGATIIAFVNVLSQLTQKVVIDRTGLSGAFDADLRWMPDGPAASTLPGGIESSQGADFNPPQLLTALQEQLGLKLQTGKSTLEVLVIDRIEHPAQD
jgi:uncharacterized protein (TIGR03435 family)